MSNYKGGNIIVCFSSMIGERLCSSSILFLTLKLNFVDRVITDRVNADIYHSIIFAHNYLLCSFVIYVYV